MTDQDDRRNQRPRRVIHDAREQAQAARNQVLSELVAGSGVSVESRRQLATATVQYWDVLREYRDAREDQWEEAGVDELANAIDETVPVEVPAPGDTGTTRTEERPALLSIEPWTIVEISKRLDELANDMGFAAHVAEADHRTEIDDDLMEEVREWQKQHLEA